MTDLSKKRVLVTGGAGFLGSYIVSELRSQGCDVVFVPRYEFLDFRNPTDVQTALRRARPNIVIHAAAKVGGIAMNQAKPAEMFYDNLVMGANLIHYAQEANVEKFVQIGSACEYPGDLKPPFLETEIWGGYPEPTNAAYGVAKRALLTMGQAYREQYNFNVIHLLLTNLYGPRDNFDSQTSHVIPGMIRKFVEARESRNPLVTLWGTGLATREFLYAEDAAKAVVRATQVYNDWDPLNIGTGSEIKIKRLASTISQLVGYKGRFVFDAAKRDGQARRELNVEKMQKVLDFYPPTVLSFGLAETIRWYKENRA